MFSHKQTNPKEIFILPIFLFFILSCLFNVSAMAASWGQIPVKIALTSETGNFTFQTFEQRDPAGSTLDLIEFPLHDANLVPLDEQRVRVELDKPLRFRLFTDNGEFYADRSLSSFVIRMKPRYQEIITYLYPGRVMAFNSEAHHDIDSLINEIHSKGAYEMARREILHGISRPELRRAEVLSFSVDVEKLGEPQGAWVYGFSILSQAYADITLIKKREQQLLPVSIPRVKMLFRDNDPVLKEYGQLMMRLTEILRTQIQRGWIDGYQAYLKNSLKKLRRIIDEEKVVQLHKPYSCKKFFR